MKKIGLLITLIFVLSSCIKEDIEPLNEKSIDEFNGYKVESFTKLTEVNYWRNSGVMWDVIANHFLKRIDGGEIFFPQLMVGDFNKDGWIDIFNPGTGSFGGKPFDGFSWLIWNPEIKTFEKKNLFNDKSFTYFGGNQRKTISLDLNNDGYTDNIIFDHGDDISSSVPRQPVRFVVSDGKGNYDLKLSNIPSGSNYFHGGDVGDLDNDGKLDLVAVDPDKTYIAWGNDSDQFFDTPDVYYEMGGATWNLLIFDVNKDGNNDLVFGGSGIIKIFYNDGNRKFSKKTIISFNGSVLMNDFKIIDYNKDGLNDIITTGSDNYDDFFMRIYTQTEKYTFKETNDVFIYTINSNRKSNQYGSSWKPWLILHDFNQDGLDDISYIDPHNFWNTSLRRKSVFVREGNKFIEEDFYKYDSFCSTIKP